ncbi:uncharacterized protein LOC143299089 isoform X2 [Babylonia areolata]|uniref:uncharacterized protein LOC143299089 isoform X2 n=2 Tax=Babylonia areolata TaxID=304850 RepID=UPI003FD0B332
MTNADIEPLHFGKYHSLTFDKTAYKVHANTMLSGDAQDILRSKLPAERSPEDIEQVVLSLQYVNDFAKLPVTLQHKLVETAYYIWVSSNRVILRQGHVPRNYYFVLLGQAMSKRFRADGKTETTAIIRKGDGFGSLAIFNQCPRLVTVISQTPLHLLVIPKGEIITHFIKGYAQTSQDNLDFLSKLWFMQSWPQELLVKCPSQYRWRWFRRTEIVEFDSDKSEWIYVITAGTLKVFQRFPVRRRSLSTVRFSVDSSVSTSRTGSQICSKHCPLTDQEAGSQQSEANAGRNASGTSTIMRVIFTEKAAESGMTKHKVKGQKSLPSDSVPVIAESSESYKLTGCSPSPPERRKSCLSPSPSERRKSCPSPSPPERRKSCPSPSPSERRKSCLSPSPSERRKSCLSPSPSERRKSCPSPSPSERRKSCPSPSPSERRKSCLSPSPSERRKSCLSPSPSERRKSCLSLSPPERRKSWLQNCNYKLVDTLHSLEVFGLEDLCLDPTHPPPKRRLLLISEGVECLLLSKNFYLQMASPRLRQNVRSHLSKLAHTQVTSADCSLIPLGGVQKDPNTILFDHCVQEGYRKTQTPFYLITVCRRGTERPKHHSI